MGFVNKLGILRHDISEYLNAYFFKFNMDADATFAATYPNRQFTKNKGKVFLYRILMNKDVRKQYDKLYEEKSKQINIFLEIRDTLESLKLEGKWNLYTDLMKVYINLIKDKETAKKDDGINLDNIDF